MTDIQRIRDLCAAGTEAHGDEFYGPILAALDAAPEPELGIKVNLIDVFDAWGQREAKDTAMLIDLCLGAALEQLVPMFHEPGLDALWPAEVSIKAEALERLAGSGRILRLEMTPGQWSVRLSPPDGYDEDAFNDRVGWIGTLRRHITAFYDYHSYYETLADSVGEGIGLEFHEERRKLGEKLVAVLAEHATTEDPPRELAPGEKASDEKPPENENRVTPLNPDAI